MTKQPEIRRRCKKCGHVYRYHFSFLGIPRCPKCWGNEFECVEYVNSKGRVIKDYQPYKDLAEFIPCLAMEDKGCEIATDFLGSQSKCVCCPFLKCVDDKEITYIEREYLKKWRDVIRVYKLADEGLKIITISHKAKVSRYLIDEWLKRRDFFEPFLKQPAMAGGVE